VIDTVFSQPYQASLLASSVFYSIGLTNQEKLFTELRFPGAIRK
jgi:hypothetical protein